MELLPVVCLCLLTRCGVTSADGSEPVVVTVEQDEDALLPCSLSTKNIEQGYFDWNKVPQNNEKQKEVFRYEGGRHSNTGYGSQDDGFKGRAFHFQEELKHGNASIIIRKTKMADNGTYTCTFTEPRQTFHIQLVVGAAPKPVVTTHKTQQGVLLLCEVQGRPQPTVEWQDSAGNVLLSGETQVSRRGSRMYFTVNTTVTRSDDFRCVATQETLSHQIYTEIYVSVNGKTVISVHEGDAAPLPCSLSTEHNIEAEMFEWKKDGLKEVFFYGGIHYNTNSPGQSEEFKGRVSHFPHKLKHGDASITIRNTKMADSGDYTCDFPRLQPRQTFYIKLDVENSGSGVHSSDQTFRKVMIGVAVGVLAKSLFL